MSGRTFKDVAGEDGIIDKNEYYQYSKMRHPFLNAITGDRYADKQFAKTDKDKNGKLNYYDFVYTHSKPAVFFPKRKN
ncbi:unnamed protein product [Brachionus calyciflorus]|uniref:EF-hand domain-containing protein n=1 Tax=Brachionus calyciflorus TaxID=104777 RepID=A0A814KS40_9BILA|nr:unnamed protein product [Brachionus calyciflorus]